MAMQETGAGVGTNAPLVPLRSLIVPHVPDPAAETAPPDDDQLLRDTAVAEWIGLEPKTLRNMRSRGDGPPWVRVGDKAIRYRRGAVRAWLAAREIGGDVA